MSNKNGLLIYGSYGYTGRLICKHALEKGIKPVLAGRDETKIKQQAQELGLNYLVFDLTDHQNVVKTLRPFQAVLHCAGPFIRTSLPMINACLEAKTHYLDITGEYQVFEQAYKLDEKAKAAEILVMPGVGFDVVPSDCLIAYLHKILPTAHSIEIVLSQQGGRLSQGTAITVAENLGQPTMARRNGKLEKFDNGSLVRAIKVDNKTKQAVAISWGDISSGFRSTKIPNITVYNALPPKVINSMKWSNYIGFILRSRWVKNKLINNIKKRPSGPSETERGNASSLIWGEAKNALGISKTAKLNLPEGYTLTYLTAVDIAIKVLNSPPAFGAKTPSQVFGCDYILQFEGVSRKDLS